MTNDEKRKAVWNVSGIVYTILTAIAVTLIISKVSIDSTNWFNWGWIIISLEIIYTVLSFKTVGPTEKGIFLLFSDPLYELKPGLVFVPFGICEAKKMPGVQIQIQIPADPEFVDKSGDDSKKIPEGMVKPIRATTSSFESLPKELQEEIKDFKDDPLNGRMTVEISMAIRYFIKDPVKMLKNIGNIKEIEKQIRDTAEAVIKSEIGKKTPYLIIRDLKSLNDTLDNRINDLVGINEDGSEKENAWGIDVTDAQIVDVDLGKKVNESLRDARAALLNRKTTITNSEAEKTKLENIGLGNAAAKEAANKVEINFLKKQAKIAETEGGKISIAMDIAGTALEKAKITYFPGTGADLVGVIAKAGEIFKDIGSGTGVQVEKKKKEGGKK